jgi:hypothetical protein
MPLFVKIEARVLLCDGIDSAEPHHVEETHRCQFW